MVQVVLTRKLEPKPIHILSAALFIFIVFYIIVENSSSILLLATLLPIFHHLLRPLC